MNAPRMILSLSLSLFAGMSLAACDGVVLDGKNPEGRACEQPNTELTCGGDEELVSYCGYMEMSDPGQGYGDLLQGPCLAPEEVECVPGEHRSDPAGPYDDEICGPTRYSCEVVGGEPMWLEIPCITPLVLRFDERPVELIDAEATPAATFDINMRANSCLSTDWPTAATPWLAIDLDHSGTIDGGHELFGSGSRLASGQSAEHGFAALAELDDNRDGVVDAKDSRFGELLLWRDYDADRDSSADELETLASAGVERLPVDYRVQTQCDARGNCGVERADFEFAGGVGEIVDLYLACQ